MDEMDGDNCLSSVDRQLWAIHQDVLFRWATYCIFKHQHINVPEYKAEHIEFFVPRDATFRYEIEAHLKHELGSFESKPTPADGGMPAWPGTKVTVRIMPFKGIDFHVPRDVVEKMAREAAKNFKQAMIDRKKKKKDE